MLAVYVLVWIALGWIGGAVLYARTPIWQNDTVSVKAAMIFFCALIGPLVFIYAFVDIGPPPD